MKRRAMAAAIAAMLAAAGCGGTEKEDGAPAKEAGSGVVVLAGSPEEAVLAYRTSASGERVKGLSRQGVAAVPVLLFVMTGEDTRDAIAAAEEMAEIGPDAIPSLTALLRSKSPRGRGWAAWALGEMGPAARKATAALKEAGNDPDLRVAVNEALHKIGN